MKTLTPVKENNSIKLELNPELFADNALCTIESITIDYCKYYKHNSCLRIDIRHNDREKNSVLSQFAARHLDADDGRMAEYRKHFPAILKHLQANGCLYRELSEEQLNKPKRIRWSQKAGCSCGCSPAFKMPSWFSFNNHIWYNTINVTLREKPDCEVQMLFDTNKLKAILPVEITKPLDNGVEVSNV